MFHDPPTTAVAMLGRRGGRPKNPTKLVRVPLDLGKMIDEIVAVNPDKYGGTADLLGPMFRADIEAAHEREIAKIRKYRAAAEKFEADVTRARAGDAADPPAPPKRRRSG
jgi:hypothetical protein